MLFEYPLLQKTSTFSTRIKRKHFQYVCRGNNTYDTTKLKIISETNNTRRDIVYAKMLKYENCHIQFENLEIYYFNLFKAWHWIHSVDYLIIEILLHFKIFINFLQIIWGVSHDRAFVVEPNELTVFFP